MTEDSVQTGSNPSVGVRIGAGLIGMIAVFICITAGADGDSSNASAQLVSMVAALTAGLGIGYASGLFSVISKRQDRRSSQPSKRASWFVPFYLIGSALMLYSAIEQFITLVSGDVDPSAVDRLSAVALVMLYLGQSWLLLLFGQQRYAEGRAARAQASTVGP
ncbi:MAG TPA: hypothetical protein VK694_03580 [Verrucomicrobiae bacterium]|nr:hypothetical protein [Verrucomicrobiae bacterium]